MVLMALGNSNSNATIAEDETCPTLLGVRGGHSDVPILLLGGGQPSDGLANETFKGGWGLPNNNCTHLKGEC